jgi:hypothetical protein
MVIPGIVVIVWFHELPLVLPWIKVVLPKVWLFWLHVLPVLGLEPCIYVELPYRWMLYEFPEASLQVRKAPVP